MGSLSIIHRGLGGEGFAVAGVTPTQGMEPVCPRAIGICSPGRTRATSFLRMESIRTPERAAAVEEVELMAQFTRKR